MRKVEGPFEGRALEQELGIAGPIGKLPVEVASARGLRGEGDAPPVRCPHRAEIIKVAESETGSSRPIEVQNPNFEPLCASDRDGETAAVRREPGVEVVGRLVGQQGFVSGTIDESQVALGEYVRASARVGERTISTNRELRALAGMPVNAFENRYGLFD